MKTILSITLLFIATTASAQVSNNVAQNYINEVFEMSQGFIDTYGVHENGAEYARGSVNEHMSFSLLRTMIGMITSTNSNIELVESWTRSGDNYTYMVLIDRKHLLITVYQESGNNLIVGYTSL